MSYKITKNIFKIDYKLLLSIEILFYLANAEVRTYNDTSPYSIPLQELRVLGLNK